MPRGLRGPSDHGGGGEACGGNTWSPRAAWHMQPFLEPFVHACLLRVCRVPGPRPGRRKAGPLLRAVTSHGGARACAAGLGGKGLEGVTGLLSGESLVGEEQPAPGP